MKDKIKNIVKQIFEQPVAKNTQKKPIKEEPNTNLPCVYLIIMFNCNGYEPGQIFYPICFKTEKEAYTYCLNHNQSDSGISYTYRKILVGKINKTKKLPKLIRLLP